MLATAPTKWLKVSNLVPGKNPRGTKFGVADLLESFDRGAPILHNVVVRAVAGTREKYEIIAGHRRVEAARRKGLAQVEAKIIEADDLMAEQLALEENLRRRALPDEPTALARLLEVYEELAPTKRGGDRRSKNFGSNRPVATLKSGIARLVEVTGQSERDVRRRVKIGLSAIPKVKRALTEGRVGVHEAERLARLTPRQQDEQLAGLVKRKGDVGSDLRRVSQALKYAMDHLKTKKPGAVSTAALMELEVLAKAVVKSIATLTPRRGRRTRRSNSSARTSSTRDVADAVSFTPKSFNAKLSPVGHSPSGADRPRPVAMKPYVSSTSASIQTTCPSECAFKSTPGNIGGCYADSGFTRIKIRKLDDAAEGHTSLAIIREHARQIDAAFRGGRIPQDGARGGRDLRLNVAGDVQTAAEAGLLGGAATRWKKRGGGDCWTFTHSWREIPRSAWGPDVSVLASVENPRDMLFAKKQGYGAALVVESFPEGDKAFRLDGAKNTRVVPCPFETRGTHCTTCRLCLRPDAVLKMNAAIAFQIHGQHADKAVAAVRLAAGSR